MCLLLKSRDDKEAVLLPGKASFCHGRHKGENAYEVTLCERECNGCPEFNYQERNCRIESALMKPYIQEPDSCSIREIKNEETKLPVAITG